MVYALIKDGIVENTIIADQYYIDAVQSQYDYCTRIDNIATPDKWTKNGEEDLLIDPEDETWTYVPGIRTPGIGWSYNGENFTPPVEEE